MNSKSRPLSPYQFFEVVQIEYICAVLRARIYQGVKDRTYWNRVAEGKKVKINEIADRNSLPSIFTDSDLMDTLSKRVYVEGTTPCFVYKNEDHKLQQEYYDFYYYYSVGKEVRFLLDSEMVVGVIKSYKTFSQNIEVEYKGKVLTLPTKLVMRVL